MTTIYQQIDTPATPAVSLDPVSVGVGGASSNGSDFLDVQTTSITGAQSWTDYFIGVPDGVTVTSNAPTTLDFTDAAQLKRVAGTNCSIKITGIHGLVWHQTVSFNYVASGSYSVPRGYTAGSIPKFCYDLISPLLVEGKSMSYFSVVNHGTATYTPNSDCWAAGFDLSGVSVWTSRSTDFRRACTAVTRRHCRMAWHYRLEPGDTVKFRRPDGTIDTHTVLAVNPGDSHPDFPYFHENTSVGDVCIILLDRNLHESIQVYPIAEWAMNVISLPSENPEGITVTYGFGAWVPFDSSVHFAAALIYLNQLRQVCPLYLADLDSAATTCGTTQEYGSATLPIWASYYPLNRVNYTANTAADFRASVTAWQVVPTGGDSGSPVFCPTGGDGLALVTCFTTGTSGMAPNADVLNAIITATDAAASVTTGLTVIVAPDPTL